jgi:Fe-Mn family superoxide dismutase
MSVYYDCYHASRRYQRKPHNAPEKGASNHELEIGSELLECINRTFGGIDQMKSSMSAATLGMMGSGWVWLVTDAQASQMAYVPSYGPGTMLVRSRQHRHPEGLSEDPIPQRFAVLGEPLPSKSDDLSMFTTPRTDSSSKEKDYRTLKGGVYRDVPIRSFHNSAINFSPLLSLRRQAPRAPQFSQTPLPLPALEPLSKQNSASPYSTLGNRDDNDVLFDDDVAEIGTSIPEPASQPLEKEPYPSLQDRHNNMLSFATTPKSWNPSRWRDEGDDLTPLFCISVHEHAWMTDYGVWGKEEYLKRFWTVLDWGKVNNLYERWRQVASSGPKHFS